MNGHDEQVSKFAHTLRVSLFEKHFGLKYEDVKDPISDSNFERFKEIADVRNYLEQLN